MARTLWPADAVSGSPSYSGRKLRQTLGVLIGGAKSSRPLGGRSGVRPGSGTLGAATSTTWTINPHAGYLDLESSAAAGGYFYSIDDTSNTGTVTAADATNPRVDIVYLTLNDPAESDGSSTPDVVPGYLAGTPAASPSAPATPARSMVLFTISVPKSGSGSPSVTNAAPTSVAAGAPVPVSTQAERDALSAYAGLSVARLDKSGRREVYDGTNWRFLDKPGVSSRRTADYGLDNTGLLSPALMTCTCPELDASSQVEIVCYLPGASSTVSTDRAEVLIYDTAGTQCGAGYLNVTAGVGGATTIVCDAGGSTGFAATAGGSFTMKAKSLGSGTVTLRFVEGGTLRARPYQV